MFRRAVADLDLVETVGFAAIERANKEDLRLNALMDRIRLEIAYPLLPPVVTSLSRAYFGIFPSLNLLCVPLTEGRFLLHLPDLYHEIGHPLLRAANNPVVEPFRQAHDRVMQSGDDVPRRRVAEPRSAAAGPRRWSYTLECWVRSWVSWSVEFLCDLFGAFTVGPAFAWSHLHLRTSAAATRTRPLLLADLPPARRRRGWPYAQRPWRDVGSRPRPPASSDAGSTSRRSVAGGRSRNTGGASPTTAGGDLRPRRDGRRRDRAAASPRRPPGRGLHGAQPGLGRILARPGRLRCLGGAGGGKALPAKQHPLIPT